MKRILKAEDDAATPVAKRARFSLRQRCDAFVGLRSCSDSLVSVVPKDIVDSVVPYVRPRGLGRRCSIIKNMDTYSNGNINGLCFYSNSRCIALFDDKISILSLPNLVVEHEILCGITTHIVCGMVDANDNIIIGDIGTDSLQVFSSSFLHVRNHLDILACDMTLDNDANYVVLENARKRVTVLTETGLILRVVSISHLYCDTTIFVSVALRSNGNVVLNDVINKLIYITTHDGTVLSHRTGAYERVIVNNADQIIFHPVYNQCLFRVFDESGDEFALTADRPGNPFRFTVSTDGKLLVADRIRYSLTYIDTY